MLAQPAKPAAAGPGGVRSPWVGSQWLGRHWRWGSPASGGRFAASAGLIEGPSPHSGCLPLRDNDGLGAGLAAQLAGDFFRRDPRPSPPPRPFDLRQIRPTTGKRFRFQWPAHA